MVNQECLNPPRQDVSNAPAAPRRVFLRDLTFEEQLALMWSWWWRQMCMGALAMALIIIPSFIFGIVFAVVLGMHGKNANEAIQSLHTTLQIAGFLMGAVAGFACVFPTIRWFTQTHLGSFELQIFRIPKTTPAPAAKDESRADFVCDRCGSPVKWGQEYCLGCSEKLDYR